MPESVITYSFIIPHKNCPKLLKRCVDSIPIRSDVQIIVVDDNSDADQKPAIARKDVEVVLLDAQHAKGAGRARNVGIEKAKGKWLLFADADDCYTSYLPFLLDKYSGDNSTDIVYLNAIKFDERGNYFSLDINQLIKNYLTGKKNAEWDLRYGIWTPWSRMVKREVLENNSIRFEEIPTGNDMLFGLKASRFSKTIAAEQEIVYKYYVWPNGSVTDRLRKTMTAEDRFRKLGKRIDFYNQVGYRNSINLLGVVGELFRVGIITSKQAITYYRKYLREYHLFWGKDIACFFYELFVKRLPHKLFVPIKTFIG